MQSTQAAQTPQGGAEQAGNIRLHWCHGQTTPPLRQQLVRFWLDNGAIPEAHEAWRRCSEVGCVAADEAGNILGISTFYIDRLQAGGPTYWFYRTFVSSNARRHGLAKAVFQFSFDRLSHYATEPGAPTGVAIIIESALLENPSLAQWMRDWGLEQIGIDAHGHAVWRRDFAGYISPA